MQNKEKLWQRLADEATKKGGNGDDIVEAYKELYSAHSDRICTWLGGLFDSEIGGFYYSNSARDHEHFLPDIESTVQVIRFLQKHGIAEKSSTLDLIPDWMREKLVEFATRILECNEKNPDDK